MPSRAPSRGFTLVELLIVTAIIGLLGVILLGIVVPGCNKAGDEATEDARRFSEKMGEQVTGIDCMTVDNDGDCYVSCTVFAKGKPPIAIECAAHSWSCRRNSGCRMQKPAVKVQ